MIILKYGSLDRTKIKRKCPRCGSKFLLEDGDYTKYCSSILYKEPDMIKWECVFCEAENEEPLRIERWYEKEEGIAGIISFFVVFMFLAVVIVPMLIAVKEQRIKESISSNYKWIVTCHTRGSSSSQTVKYFATDEPTAGTDFFVYNYKGERCTGYFDTCNKCQSEEAYYLNPDYEEGK